MKWIASALLWFAACVLAAFLAYRLLRGKPVVLPRRHPRILRMAVSLLVLAGFGVGKADPQGDSAPVAPGGQGPEKAKEELPEVLSDHVVSLWRKRADYYYDRLVADRLGPDAKDPAAPVRANRILKVLDGMEREGRVHDGIVHVLWRRLPRLAPEDRTRLPEIARRLRLHARMYNALVMASAGVKPFIVKGWLSKGALFPKERAAVETSVQQILKALPAAFAKADAGPWDKDARVRLTAQGGCKIVHLGEERAIGKGETFEMNRLDVLISTDRLTLEHGWIGSFELPEDLVSTVWDLPALLPAAAEGNIRKAVDAALEGDEAVAERLELALPLVHGILRERLAEKPDAKGAPRLRLILTLFDR